MAQSNLELRGQVRAEVQGHVGSPPAPEAGPCPRSLVLAVFPLNTLLLYLKTLARISPSF